MNMARHRIVLISIVGTIGLLIASDACAQVVRREYAIKAGVIRVLTNFVQWPQDVAPQGDQPLVIAILGKDPFFENGVNQLNQVIATAKNRDKNLVVRRYRTLSDYQPCHILYVSNSAADSSDERTVAARMQEAAKVVNGQGVLLVGESPGLIRRGAAANLTYERATNVIRLEVNPDAAARAGLRFTPDLLRLSLVDIVRDPRDATDQ